jgi:type I restriction-modification system DNA methylase subunit
MEAKKPFGDIATQDNYFQTIRYGWNSQTPIAALFDFAQFEIVDCRFKPDLETALQRNLKKFHFSQFADKEVFAEIYWLFSREAVANGSLEKYAETLPKKRGAVQRGLFKGGYQSFDEAFLEELDAHRDRLAHIFKNHNPKLDGETLTELTQRTLDRLVFIRFLEDKLIEPQYLVAKFGERGSAWGDFIATSRRLDGIYNGIVFKENKILDAPSFKVDDEQFGGICESLCHINSAYDFNAIPIHILGSIYERFLGKVIVATDKRAKVEEKPEVRKAGGVYYTPEYIVRYIVNNTVGKLIEGKSPAQIAKMKFADIACGSGSFLLGVYDLLIRYHTKFYHNNPGKAKKGETVEREDGLHLSLQKKQEILLNNIYGVDIDNQAVEVAQLSLYLKLLQDETPGSTRQYFLDFEQQALLPPLNKNIVWGNSLVGTDISTSELFEPTAEHKLKEQKLNPMDYGQRFPEIKRHGGFDAVIGNPPYLLLQPQNIDRIQLGYLQSHFKVAQYKMDIFHLFIEKALSIVRNKGCVGYITPASFLTNNGTTKLRDEILSKSKINKMVVLPDGVFREASVDNVVFVCERETVELNRDNNQFPFLLAEAESDRFKINQTLKARQGDFRHNSGMIFRPEKTPGFTTIAKKMSQGSTKLGDIARVNFGMQLRDREKYPDDVLVNPPKTKITAKHKKCLCGSDVQVYRTDYSGIYCLFDRVAQCGGCWDEEIQFAKRKVLVRQIGKTPIATLETQGRCCLNALFMIKSLVEDCDDAFLLALINSRLLQVYWSNVYYDFKDTFPKIKGTYLEELPIKKPVPGNAADKARHDKVVSLVEQMLAAKKQLAGAQSDKDKDFYQNKCASLDRQIDALVYELYGLTADEIKIVEETQTK